jgi:hypothetical protein
MHRICAKRASNRKAQAKYVAKNKGKQRAAVKKSAAKPGASKKTPGEGKHGHRKGRPRKPC